MSDSKLNATESPKLFATEKKSRYWPALLPNWSSRDERQEANADLRDKFRFRGTRFLPHSPLNRICQMLDLGKENRQPAGQFSSFDREVQTTPDRTGKSRVPLPTV
jgi:hypothetical protein